MWMRDHALGREFWIAYLDAPLPSGYQEWVGLLCPAFHPRVQAIMLFVLDSLDLGEHQREILRARLAPDTWGTMRLVASLAGDPSDHEARLPLEHRPPAREWDLEFMEAIVREVPSLELHTWRDSLARIRTELRRGAPRHGSSMTRGFAT
jgi:hypothetical protein